MATPWLSIITVVKNDEPGLERTLLSIAQQQLSGVDVLIVDGSDDRAAAPGALARFALPNASIRWQAPRGVYPAMNSGLEQAAGEHIHFLNAGDQFHDEQAVSAVRAVIDEKQPTWLYGQVAFIDEAGTVVLPPPFVYPVEKARHFSRGRFPPHQGMVVRRDALLHIGGFDTSYRIAADYAAFLRLSLIADPVECTAVIADFYQGGLSSTAWRASVGEFHQARREILKPRGLDAVLERLATGRQFAAMSASRLLRTVRLGTRAPAG